MSRRNSFEPMEGWRRSERVFEKKERAGIGGSDTEPENDEMDHQMMQISTRATNGGKERQSRTPGKANTPRISNVNSNRSHKSSNKKKPKTEVPKAAATVKNTPQPVKNRSPSPELDMSNWMNFSVPIDHFSLVVKDFELPTNPMVKLVFEVADPTTAERDQYGQLQWPGSRVKISSREYPKPKFIMPLTRTVWPSVDEPDSTPAENPAPVETEVPKEDPKRPKKMRKAVRIQLDREKRKERDIKNQEIQRQFQIYRAGRIAENTADLPECSGYSEDDDREYQDRDTLVWAPAKKNSKDDETYKRTQNYLTEASKNGLAIDWALNILMNHRHKLVDAKKRVKKWRSNSPLLNEEDEEKLLKGLATYGKNFVKISMNMMNNMHTSRLIAHYYATKGKKIVPCANIPYKIQVEFPSKTKRRTRDNNEIPEMVLWCTIDRTVKTCVRCWKGLNEKKKSLSMFENKVLCKHCRRRIRFPDGISLRSSPSTDTPIEEPPQKKTKISNASKKLNDMPVLQAEVAFTNQTKNEPTEEESSDPIADLQQEDIKDDNYDVAGGSRMSRGNSPESVYSDKYVSFMYKDADGNSDYGDMEFEDTFTTVAPSPPSEDGSKTTEQNNGDVIVLDELPEEVANKEVKKDSDTSKEPVDVVINKNDYPDWKEPSWDDVDCHLVTQALIFTELDYKMVTEKLGPHITLPLVENFFQMNNINILETIANRRCGRR